MEALSGQGAALALAEFFAMEAHAVHPAVREHGPMGFLCLPEGELKKLVPRKAAKRWLEARDAFDPADDLKALEAAGVTVLLLDGEGYPPVLGELQDPPLALFVKGALPPLDQPRVAVVGSRHPDSYGRRVAADLGRNLAQAGVSVISGGAMGVDSLTHRAVVDEKGHTVAVLGMGILEQPTSRQLPLFRDILETGGAILSEYGPRDPPDGFRFPYRNRVISGLAQAVVVVQAKYRSGTQITVRHALEQGREVFAFPGNVYSELSQGCHEMIREGAAMVTGAHDVLMDMGWVGIEETPADETAPPPNLSGHMRDVYRVLEVEPRHTDAICQASGLSAQLVGTALVMLEMDNLVRQVTPGSYIRLAAALPGGEDEE